MTKNIVTTASGRPFFEIDNSLIVSMKLGIIYHQLGHFFRIGTQIGKETAFGLGLNVGNFSKLSTENSLSNG